MHVQTDLEDSLTSEFNLKIRKLNLNFQSAAALSPANSVSPALPAPFVETSKAILCLRSVDVKALSVGCLRMLKPTCVPVAILTIPQASARSHFGTATRKWPV